MKERFLEVARVLALIQNVVKMLLSRRRFFPRRVLVKEHIGVAGEELGAVALGAVRISARVILKGVDRALVILRGMQAEPLVDDIVAHLGARRVRRAERN